MHIFPIMSKEYERLNTLQPTLQFMFVNGYSCFFLREAQPICNQEADQLRSSYTTTTTNTNNNNWLFPVEI